MKVNILGIKIDNLTKNEVFGKIADFLRDNKQHYIVTVNPEFVVVSQKDQKFKEILNEADLAVPDGIGLIFASYWQKIPLKKRICGVDLILDLAAIAEKENYSLYLLGAKEERAREAGQKLKNKFPQLKISGAESGGRWDENLNNDSKKEVIKKINEAKPEILLVALGQVRQEKWINYYLKQLPSVKIAIGVGGSFDYLSEKIKRAPYILRRIGLEWLWRLILEPKRFKRIYNATLKFPFLVLSPHLPRIPRSKLRR